MKPKYQIGDWVWFKFAAKEVYGDSEKEEDFRAQIFSVDWSSTYDDFKYNVFLVDFPYKTFSVYQQNTLPYYAKKYDGRFEAAKDLALRNSLPENWYTEFNLYQVFVPSINKEGHYYGKCLIDGKQKVFFIKECPETLKVKVLEIENSLAILEEIPRYNLEYKILRNSN